eukprot:313623-Prymnesium_polylepis.1
MTLGSRGCMLVRDGAPPHHVAIPPECKGIKVVDTTGAHAPAPALSQTSRACHVTLAHLPRDPRAPAT